MNKQTPASTFAVLNIFVQWILTWTALDSHWPSLIMSPKTRLNPYDVWSPFFLPAQMRLAANTPIPQSILPGLIRTHLQRLLQQGLMGCSPPSVSRKPILSHKASYLQVPRHRLRLRQGQPWLSALVQLRPQPYLQLPLQRHQVRI